MCVVSYWNVPDQPHVDSSNIVQSRARDFQKSENNTAMFPLNAGNIPSVVSLGYPVPARISYEQLLPFLKVSKQKKPVACCCCRPGACFPPFKPESCISNECDNVRFSVSVDAIGISCHLLP
jgi:hypothetical protein